jgi:hypothetical protein
LVEQSKWQNNASRVLRTFLIGFYTPITSKWMGYPLLLPTNSMRGTLEDTIGEAQSLP